MAAIEELKARREIWIDCFNGEHRQAICQQISQMLWNAAAFRTINEARRLAPPDEKGNSRINGMMHRLIDGCFFDSQMLSIRRLSDSFPIADHPGGRDVCSLTSLIGDMRDRVHLMTRENMFAALGLDYDYSGLQEKESQFIEEKLKNEGRVGWLPPEFDWLKSERFHGVMDALCAVEKEARSPADTVRKEVLSHLLRRVEGACVNVKNHVNKHVAHAASPASLATVDSESLRVTLDQLWGVHRVICEVANFVDTYLLTRTSHMFLPTPQYDQLEHMDLGLVETGKVVDLHRFWSGYEQETQKWGAWGIDDLLKEMN